MKGRALTVTGEELLDATALSRAATVTAGAATPAQIVTELMLLLSFFISGCTALAYQVGWQRALFAQIGVDIDSITIIVSVFMLGIGVGAMIGGWLADIMPRRRLHLYGLVELSIGVFGIFSLQLLGGLVATLAPPGTGVAASTVACFVFLLVPTVLMGMTLPLLTMEFDERRDNIGVSVGTLYFTNTLGAAAGAALVPLHLLNAWTLPQVILMAALGNFAVIACVLLAVLATRQGR